MNHPQKRETGGHSTRVNSRATRFLRSNRPSKDARKEFTTAMCTLAETLEQLRELTSVK